MCYSRLDCRCFKCSLASFAIGSLYLLLKPISLLMVLACLMLTGCENPVHDLFSKTPDLYIPAGKCAEVRKPVTIYTWSHDKDGNPVRSHYHAYPGCNVAPGAPTLKVSEIK
jgi:hypothetical protein